MILNVQRLLDSDTPSQFIPREIDKNIRFRNELFSWLAHEGKPAQELVWDWCRKDVMFFADAFVWMLDPKRHPGNPLQPWITLPFQKDELFPGIESSFGPPNDDERVGHPMVGLKSRDMGFSVAVCIAVVRRILCFDYQVYVVISASEKLVDDRSNPNSLLPKMDIIMARLPDFMKKGVVRVNCKITRPDALCVVDGMSTTGDTSRSGRPHGIIIDEFAAWPKKAAKLFLAASQSASNCRLFFSSAQGKGTAFHTLATNPTLPRVELHWTKHPWHSRGLYWSDGPGGLPNYRDKEFWEKTRFDWLEKRFPILARTIKIDKGVFEKNPLLKDVYRFVCDGKKRSPFYDDACEQAPYPWIIKQELDMEFLGSSDSYYDEDRLLEYIDKKCQVPFSRGFLSYDPFTFEPLEFVKDDRGSLSLWMNLSYVGEKLAPPDGKNYLIGVDVSAGTGASNSCLSIWDVNAREKLASLVDRNLRPERFAEVAYAVGKWFHDAEIIAEGQGHGQPFHARLLEIGYHRVYWMTDRKGKRLEDPGVHFDRALKKWVLDDYYRCLIDGELVCRDMDSVREGTGFQLTQDGRAEHIESLMADMPAASGTNHGDRWMADCVAWHGLRRYAPAKRLLTPIEERPAFWRPSEEEDREVRLARARW